MFPLTVRVEMSENTYKFMRRAASSYTRFIYIGGCFGFLYGNYVASKTPNISARDYINATIGCTVVGFGAAGAFPLLLPAYMTGAISSHWSLSFSDKEPVVTTAISKH
jgi:hypothetical protein